MRTRRMCRVWHSLGPAGSVASWSTAVTTNVYAIALEDVAPRNPKPLVGLRVVSTVGRVAIATQPSSVVTEGRPFAVQPVVTVTDTNGAPLANQVVFALLVESDGVRLPLLLLPNPSTGITVKMPVNITAATDASGVARFTQLGFQVW